MNFTLKRDVIAADGAYGVFAADDGSTDYQTLERAFATGPGGAYTPAIPAGVYTCQRRLSPHFDYDVFEVLNVPGHSYIEIHRANTQLDLEGCIGLGLRRGYMMGFHAILDSRVAFERFMELMEGTDTFQLTVI